MSARKILLYNAEHWAGSNTRSLVESWAVSMLLKTKSKCKSLGMVTLSFYVSPIPPMPSTLTSAVLRIKMTRGEAGISIIPRERSKTICTLLSMLGGLGEERESNCYGFHGYVCPNRSVVQTIDGKGIQTQLIGFEHSGEEELTWPHSGLWWVVVSHLKVE